MFIARLIEKTPSLKELDLSGKPFVIAFSAHFKFRENCIGMNGALDIFRALGKNRTLERLYLNDNLFRTNWRISFSPQATESKAQNFSDG